MYKFLSECGKENRVHANPSSNGVCAVLTNVMPASPGIMNIWHTPWLQQHKAECSRLHKLISSRNSCGICYFKRICA